MAGGEKKTILSGISVRDAMRRQLVRLPGSASLDRCINRMIKYKINGLLIDEADSEEPAGVVSKTDIMGAYFAGLPVETPASDIMMGPPLFCRETDSLESALERMRENGVYRLYVRNEKDESVVGAIAYPDIVGLLYRYCHECEYSRAKRGTSSNAVDTVARFTVREVMTPSVKSYPEDAILLEIMEGISAYRFGAVLISDRTGRPKGVVSKTDLALAYRHGVSPSETAAAIMSTPVRAVAGDDFLESAVRILIFSQVHRIFVYQGDPDRIVGVLSLTDAARMRSGSCQACVSSRIKVEQGA